MANTLPPCRHRTVTAWLRRIASEHVTVRWPPYRHRSQAMVSAILLFEEKINAWVIECLREIEHVAGRPVLTGAYNKLLALSRA